MVVQATVDQGGNLSTVAPLDPRQRVRFAGPAIRGYLYQFDHTILKVLNLRPGDVARVEGVEDVDLLGSSGSEAIQIKYLASSKYTSPKALREPILEMLRSFAGGREWHYVLHVHFSEGSPPESLSVAELKESLTKTSQTTGVTTEIFLEFEEDVLARFVAEFEIKTGESLDAQQHKAEAALAEALACSAEEARTFHYPLALKAIQQYAIQDDEQDRLVTREDFLSQVNIKDVLYDRWHREIVGEEAYRVAIAKRLKRVGLARNDRYRAILVDLSQTAVPDVARLAAALSRDFIGRNRLYSARPWSLILRGPVDRVRELKRTLLESSITFNDGFEEIWFSVAAFSQAPVLNTKGRGSSVIARASYSLRLITESRLQELAEADERFAVLLVLGEGVAVHSEVSREEPVIVRGIDLTEIVRILEEMQ